MQWLCQEKRRPGAVGGTTPGLAGRSGAASRSGLALHKIPPMPRLSPDIAAFLPLGLSLHAGACDPDGTPQLARALACRVEADGRIALLVPAVPGAGFLQAVARSGSVAVVCCQPTTHRTIQLKGRGADVASADLADWPQRERNRSAFADEILPFGFDATFSNAWFDVPANTLMAVRFVPTGAWNQTPGPGAGGPMELWADGLAPPAVDTFAPPATAPVPPAATREVALSSVRRMFEGVIPAALCTVSADRTPHVCFVSQAEYLDDGHLALSFQFLNRSRQNILATRRAALTVDDPLTARSVCVQIEYLRTEAEGPLFERMNAKLAGLATHTGMGGVFHLRGADVYRVLGVRSVAGHGELVAPPPRCELGPAVRAASERIAACADMATLLDESLAALQQHLRIDHAMLLLADTATRQLCTVASRGYANSGVGSEIPFGQGVAGIAAQQGVPIRIGHTTMWQTYSRAVRQRTQDLGLGGWTGDEIPLPSLAEPRSQMAVPLRLRGRVIGVLLVESTQDQFFSYDDEDALTVLASQLATALTLLQPGEAEPPAAPARPAPSPRGEPVVVRHYPHDDSVFLGGDYLIRGVAGAIFRKLVHDHLQHGRSEFSNRELRLDASLKLPDVADNLEARLILLQRRLAERGGAVQIEKTGRGRFRLALTRPLSLETVAA
jgi:putative methionine-R-sulfoxide reductase with GAF domain